jgi:hypothetical protein
LLQTKGKANQEKNEKKKEEMSPHFFFLHFVLKTEKAGERTCAQIHEQREISLVGLLARCRCIESG